MRSLPSVIAVVGLACAAGTACSPERQHYVPNSLGGNLTPTMATTDVNTLISDSGYTRYKVVTPLWLMFEDADEPFWRFPQGIELEQFDLAMNPESSVVADSAVYLSRKRVWQLDGNVVMVNTDRDSFLTQQLFWEQSTRKIYTDSFIHIVRSDRTIEGYGFESDQSMKWYTVTHPTAILPARKPGTPETSDKTDSADKSDRAGASEKPEKPVPSENLAIPTIVPDTAAQTKPVKRQALRRAS